jgi:O-antigen ligase
MCSGRPRALARWPWWAGRYPPSPEFSIPKLCGILLGIGAYSATISTLRRACPPEYQRLTRFGAVLYLGVGAIIAVFSFLLAAPASTEADWAAAVYAARPPVPVELRSSHGLAVGIHPNEIAGALTLFLPLSIALVAYQPWRLLRGEKARPSQASWLSPRLAQVAVWLSLALMSAVLLLTLSRGGLFAVAVGAFCLAAWRRGVIRPDVLWAWLILVALGLPLLGLLLPLAGNATSSFPVALSPERIELLAHSSEIVRTFAVRLDLWHVALRLLTQHLWAGVGLNTLPLYFADRDSAATQLLLFPHSYHFFNHAHSLFLQTALDLGIPGVLFFLILLGIAGRNLCRGLLLLKGTFYEVVAGGVMASLVSHMVFSSTDAVTLGAKPGIFLWILLGVAVSLPTSGTSVPNDDARDSRTVIGRIPPWALR